MLAGVDLGGTKTEIICLTPDTGAEIFRHREAPPRGTFSCGALPS